MEIEDDDDDVDISIRANVVVGIYTYILRVLCVYSKAFCYKSCRSLGLPVFD